MTIEEQQKQQLDKEIMRVVKKARRHSWNRTALEDAFEKALGSLEAPAVILSDDEEEEEEEEELEEEQTTPVRHFKKDRIGPKERKKPIPWTEDDEEFLVDLICKQGAKWAHFETMYSSGKLYGRNQTALKDKARNIMRKIIDNDQEEEWLERFPLWSQVTVGQARRGVHAYQNGKIPPRRVKRSYVEMVE